MSEKEVMKRKNKVFVGGIPHSVTTYQLWEFFSQFGLVVDALVVKDKRTRKSRGFGFVSFSNQNGMTKALKAGSDDVTLKGRVLNVSLPEPKKLRSCFGDIKEDKCIKETNKNATNNKTVSEAQQLNFNGVTSKDVNETKIETELLDRNTDPKTESQIIDLNDDVMEIIFGHLSLRDLCRMNSVNKRWDQVLKSVWKQKKSLDLSYFSIFNGKGLTTKILAILLSKTQKGLAELNLSLHSSTLSYTTLEMVGKLCPNLAILDISGLVVTEDNMIKFAQFCPNVQNLTANSCERFNEKAAWRLLHSLQNLRVLSLQGNARLTGKCLRQAGPHITSLDFTNCTALLSAGIDLAISHCPALTHLRLAGCSSLDDTVVSHLLASKLTHLDLSCVRSQLLNLTQPSEFAKVGNISTLQNLNVGSNYLVTDLLLENLSSLPGLTHLDLSGCNGGADFPGVTDVGLFCLHNIAHLDISYLSAVTDAALRHLSTFKSLKTVEMCGSPVLTNAGAEALVTCPSLALLDFSGCRGITAEFLDQLVAQRSVIMEHLEVVLGGTLAHEVLDLHFSQLEAVTIQVVNNCVDRRRPDYVDYVNFGFLFSDSESSDDDFNDGWSYHLDDSWNSGRGWGEYGDDENVEDENWEEGDDEEGDAEDEDGHAEYEGAEYEYDEDENSEYEDTEDEHGNAEYEDDKDGNAEDDCNGDVEDEDDGYEDEDGNIEDDGYEDEDGNAEDDGYEYEDGNVEDDGYEYADSNGEDEDGNAEDDGNEDEDGNAEDDGNGEDEDGNYEDDGNDEDEADDYEDDDYEDDDYEDDDYEDDDYEDD